jgi:hypothetical protein
LSQKRRKKEGKLVQQLAEHQMEGLQDKILVTQPTDAGFSRFANYR